MKNKMLRREFTKILLSTPLLSLVNKNTDDPFHNLNIPNKFKDDPFFNSINFTSEGWGHEYLSVLNISSDFMTKNKMGGPQKVQDFVLNLFGESICRDMKTYVLNSIKNPQYTGVPLSKSFNIQDGLVTMAQERKKPSCVNKIIGEGYQDFAADVMSDREYIPDGSIVCRELMCDSKGYYLDCDLESINVDCVMLPATTYPEIKDGKEVAYSIKVPIRMGIKLDKPIYKIKFE